MYYARIIADSINRAGIRLTTLEVRYPRIILAELNTHRVFSRNTASSRAVPISRRIKDVVDDPFIPSPWGANRSGMQSTDYLTQTQAHLATTNWLAARDAAVRYATLLADNGVHKQHANRLLEPFAWVTTVVSATEWSGFFSQRRSPLAQPEFQSLASAMYDAITESRPTLLAVGEWHRPYVDQEDWGWVDFGLKDRPDGNKGRRYVEDVLCKLSVARCARVSYRPFDSDKVDRDADLAVYDKMRTANPPHWSPFEHVAVARADALFAPPRHYPASNFRGFTQFRKILEAQPGW